jgi:hypothetical protein
VQMKTFIVISVSDLERESFSKCNFICGEKKCFQIKSALISVNDLCTYLVTCTFFLPWYTAQKLMAVVDTMTTIISHKFSPRVCPQNNM